VRETTQQFLVCRVTSRVTATGKRMKPTRYEAVDKDDPDYPNAAKRARMAKDLLRG